MMAGSSHHNPEGGRRSVNSELWYACAGSLVSLPDVDSLVVYIPQGHGEQVAASTNKEFDAHIPYYPNLPSHLICQLQNVTLLADIRTDEVYARMTLQPSNPQEQTDSYTPSRRPTDYFCKILTTSDTSTPRGFLIPCRAVKVFRPLDFTQQHPSQELIVRDVHDKEWKFQHIYRHQSKKHLLTTGWSVFVSSKRLVAGDSVLFIRNDEGQLLLGIRRANTSHTVMPSSELSSDSMHIGVQAAAAHAAATKSRFTIFYNPRESPSEFVIPLAKYEKAVHHTRVSIGMRFRMPFETEKSAVRRYMGGTITSIGDLDPDRWPNSQWRSLKVGWDESTIGERQQRVSLWEIELLPTSLTYPPSYPLGLKRPRPQLQGNTSLYGLGHHGGVDMVTVSNVNDVGTMTEYARSCARLDHHRGVEIEEPGQGDEDGGIEECLVRRRGDERGVGGGDEAPWGACFEEGEPVGALGMEEGGVGENGSLELDFCEIGGGGGGNDTSEYIVPNEGGNFVTEGERLVAQLEEDLWSIERARLQTQVAKLEATLEEERMAWQAERGRLQAIAKQILRKAGQQASLAILYEGLLKLHAPTALESPFSEDPR